MKYIPFFGTRYGTTKSKTVQGGSECNNIADHEMVDDLGLNDKQDCLELDPSWEFPSLDESEEEEHKKQEDDQDQVDGREKLCTFDEDSWQILVSKSGTKKEEHKTAPVIKVSFVAGKCGQILEWRYSNLEI
ncbi:unnamed protein product [Dovyalis caffra]|uniref:Uncharacterized protein n=1 Tax=Dovyalis caffra TaxID=77055 RepID=A0AAV1R211_9ROSI|nr:unnamed protein product [Dovyalis caffra]